MPLNLSNKIWSPARSLEQESSTNQIQIQNVNNNRRLLPQFNQFQIKSCLDNENSLFRKVKKESEVKDEQQKIFPVSYFIFALFSTLLIIMEEILRKKRGKNSK